MDLVRAQEYVGVLGREWPAIDEVAQFAPDQWAIGYRDGVAITLDWIDAPARWIAIAALGEPPPWRRQAVLETLLAFNSLWKDNDGLSMAFDKEGGGTHLIATIPANQSSPEILGKQLDRFLGLAELWCAYVINDGKSQMQAPFFPLLAASFA